MKTVEVVITDKGWYVTRRYAGTNHGAQFFPFDGKKKGSKFAEAKDKYINEWIG